MKCLIVSDSHGLLEELDVLHERHKDEVDLFIHCGDSELSHDDQVIQYYQTVRGNCDFGEDFPEDLIAHLGDWSILVTHGHLYNIKSTLMNISLKGREVGANVICFGHSHIAGAEKIDDCLYINPGSIRLPRGSQYKTYVILEKQGQNAIVDFYTMSGEKLPGWQLKTTLS